MIRTRTRQRLPLLTALEPRVLFSTATPAPSVDTLTQLSASASALLVGNSLTFTATVTPASGDTLNGQWVQLWDNGTVFVVSAQLTNDTATMTWAPRSGGLHIISAEFPTQDGFLRSVSGEVDVNVYRRAAQLNLQVTTNHADGNQVQVTASAASVDPVGFAPTGSVQIFNGTQLAGTIRLGTADALNLTLGPGTYDFRATYNGDGAFFPAQAVQRLVILPAPPADGKAAEIASFDVAPAVMLEALSFSSGTGSLSSNPVAENQDGAAAFHLNSSTLPPDARQFYEFHLPPALNPDGAPPAANTADQPLIPGAFPDGASGAATPAAPTPLPPALAIPADELPVSPVPNP